MKSLDEYYEKSADLHKHLCPRQVLGVRMGSLAEELLGISLPQEDKRVFVFMETDGCAADGVSVSTGCWVGRRTMHIYDFGKVAATFVDSRTQRAFRIHPHPRCRISAREYEPEACSRWHAQLAAYQHMPDEHLLIAIPVKLTIDLGALISRAGVRAICEFCGEEIMNERELFHEGSVFCRACAGDAYYTSGVEQPRDAISRALHIYQE